MRTNLHFSSCVGRVVQCAAFIKTFTSGGGGGSVFIPGGFRHVVRPVWVRTNHVRRVEFIVQDHRDVDHSFWVEGYDDFFLREGQHVAILSANGRPVRLANFTANHTYNFCTGAELLAKKKPLGFLASAALVYGATMAACYLLGGVLVALGAAAQAHAEHLVKSVASVGNPVLLLFLVAMALRVAWGVFARVQRAARVKLADRGIASAWNGCLTLPQAMVSLRVP